MVVSIHVENLILKMINWQYIQLLVKKVMQCFFIDVKKYYKYIINRNNNGNYNLVANDRYLSAIIQFFWPVVQDLKQNK
jgi:hypothetical protein